MIPPRFPKGAGIIILVASHIQLVGYYRNGDGRCRKSWEGLDINERYCSDIQVIFMIKDNQSLTMFITAFGFEGWKKKTCQKKQKSKKKNDRKTPQARSLEPQGFTKLASPDKQPSLYRLATPPPKSNAKRKSLVID